MIDLAPFAVYTGTTRSGTEITLRPMRADDEVVFRDLYAEMRAAELQPLPWPPATRRQFCDAQYGLQDSHYRAHYTQFLPLALCAGGEVVGRLYLGEFDGALILMDIIVAANMRRHGIGTHLIEAVVRHADACGIEARLHVEPNNPIKKHYVRLGFADVGAAGIYQQMVRRVTDQPKV